jgi:hypothetical protein
MTRTTRRIFRTGAIIAGLATSASIACEQVQQIEISDPAAVKIEDLYKQADIVAVVHILSGDSEHYSDAVYKAEVRTAFKGTRNGERIYFGPFVRYAVGGEYVAFLRRSQNGIRPLDNVENTGLSYGRVDVLYRVMYQGYSMMPAEYVCVFDGKEIRSQCGNGIKINTFQVILPEGVRTYPLEVDDEPSNDKKWVRRDVLFFVLDRLRSSK